MDTIGTSVLAHGLGGVGDLPVPLPLLIGLAAGAMLGLAGLLSTRAASRHLPSGQPWTRPLPATFVRIAAWRHWPATGTTLGLALAALVLVTATLGPNQAARNPAPRLVMVAFWGGIVPASLLLGPVWRWLNPLRPLAAGLARLVGDPREDAVHPLPKRLGLWPAATGLLAFSWLELAGPDTTRALLIFLILYGVAQLGAALWYGRRWFEHGDGFEVYSTLLGHLAPVGRDAERRPALRNPLAAVTRVPVEPGLGACLAVLIAGNVADAVLAAPRWQELTAGLAPRTSGTLLLLACVALVLLLIRAALPQPFLAAAFVPVVAGYALSHHLAPLLVETQSLAAQLSDPLARGWNLFGTAGAATNYEVLPVALGAGLQLAGLLAGHLAAVAVAHRMTAARYDLRTARAIQFPLRAVLVGSLVAGIALQAAT